MFDRPLVKQNLLVLGQNLDEIGILNHSCLLLFKFTVSEVMLNAFDALKQILPALYIYLIPSSS